jgi:hypothetical protein
VHALVEKETRIGIDLRTPPLLRIVVAQGSPDLSWIILISDHFVVDGWSMTLIGTEFWSIYEAITSDRPTSLPNVPTQFIDF